MQIYISALGAYNAGQLHGAWVELTTDTTKEELVTAVNDVLRTSPTPNVWRQDYTEGEGIFEAVTNVTHSHAWGYDDDNTPSFPDTLEDFGTKTGDAYRSEEEWAVHDYDEFPNLGEYVSLDDIIEVLDLMQTYGEDVIMAIFSKVETQVKYVSGIAAEFIGKCDSFRDYSDDYADEWMDGSDAPEMLKNYFDYASFARDLKHDRTVAEYDGSVYIFGN